MMQTTAVIRAATRRDIPAMVALWEELMEFHRVRDPFFTQSANGSQVFARFVEENIRNEAACVLVATVDAQIVITDEMLKRDALKMAEKIGLAFDIIRTNAIVGISSMIPLFFSGIVEVTGFALSTILGAMLGYMITRPAYAAIVERVLEGEKAQSKEQAQA